MSWRKWVPNSIVMVSYILIWLMLLSAMGMWMGLFLGHGDWSHIQMKRDLFLFYPLTPFYTAPTATNVGWVVLCGMLCWFGWLFSTRVRLSNLNIGRRSFFFLIAWMTFTVYLGVVSAGYMKHLSYDKLLLLDTWVTNETVRPYLHTGGLRLIGWFLMLTPTYALYVFWSRLWSEYRSDPVVQEWFENYKFQWRLLGRLGDEKAMTVPDITLALDAEKNTPVVLTGDSRQLGTALIGPPGSGKTSLKIIKAFRQDLGHMQAAINAFPEYVKKYGFGTEDFKRAWAKHLIGSIIIEPAKDLCDNAYRLTLEHGIPEELVVYLDPTNPNTPGFNAMIGPLEQVAETLTAVFDGMSESTDEFFRQACRTVLKQYIYLLKFLKKNECTLLDLDRMYQDPRFTADMVEDLSKRLPDPETLARMPRDKFIFWTLADRTVKWFWNDGLDFERQNGVVVRDSKGRPKVVDKQHEFTRQTRNLISDLITNPYLARILMGKNAVDLDRLMAKGGILLCNTANGELGNVSDAFGKMVLMSVQNAVFRRKGDEKTRPLVSLYVDEFYDYMNMPFLKLSGQGRKYKIAPLVACQTLSQFDIKFGRGFTDGMLGTIRNYIVYGGVGTYDAEKLSPLFGSKSVDEMTVRESITPESMANPSYSYSESVTRKESELVTPDMIMFNKFKFSYIRLVLEGSTTKAMKAEGDFVDFGKADRWKKAINEKKLASFMTYWSPKDQDRDSFSMEWVDEDDWKEHETDDSGSGGPQNGETPSDDEKATHQEHQQKQPVVYIGKQSERFKEVPKSNGQKRFNGHEEVQPPADQRQEDSKASTSPEPIIKKGEEKREEEPPKAQEETKPVQKPPAQQQSAYQQTAVASASDLLFGSSPSKGPKSPDPSPAEAGQIEEADLVESLGSPRSSDSQHSGQTVIPPVPAEKSSPVQEESEEEKKKKREREEQRQKDVAVNRARGGKQPQPPESTLNLMRQGDAPDMNSPFMQKILNRKSKK